MSESPDKDSVPPDDTTATTPLGVGESLSKGGEERSKKDPDDREDAQSAKGDGAGPPSDEVTGINPD